MNAFRSVAAHPVGVSCGQRKERQDPCVLEQSSVLQDGGIGRKDCAHGIQ